MLLTEKILLPRTPIELPRTERDIRLMTGITPFSERVKAAWQLFANEAKHWADIVVGQANDLTEEALVAAIEATLLVAIKRVSFMVRPSATHPSKAELVISLHGERLMLLKTLRLVESIPAEVKAHWVITVGHPTDFALATMPIEGLALSDCMLWVTTAGSVTLTTPKTSYTPEELKMYETHPLNFNHYLDSSIDALNFELPQVSLAIYAPALAAKLKTDSVTATAWAHALLAQTLGDVVMLRYVRNITVLSTPRKGNAVTPAAVLDHLQRLVDMIATSPAAIAEDHYVYHRKREYNSDARARISRGMSTLPALVDQWYRGEDELFKECWEDGVFASMLTIENYTFISDEDYTDRAELCQDYTKELERISENTPSIVRFIGSANGFEYSDDEFWFIDTLVWDYPAWVDVFQRHFHPGKAPCLEDYCISTQIQAFHHHLEPSWQFVCNEYE